jgi:hypothetical protein
MKKMKSTFWKTKAKKQRKRVVLPPSGIKIATVEVDLCHRSGLEYLSHGFQTQSMVAGGASLKARPETTCVLGHGF